MVNNKHLPCRLLSRSHQLLGQIQDHRLGIGVLRLRLTAHPRSWAADVFLIFVEGEWILPIMILYDIHDQWGESGSESNTKNRLEKRASCSMVVLKFRHELAQLPLHLQKTCHATRNNHFLTPVRLSASGRASIVILYIFSQSASAYSNLWVYIIYIYYIYNYTVFWISV